MEKYDTPEFDAMRMGVDYRFPIQIRKWRVTVRPITIAEHMQITNETVSEVMETPPEMRHAINENYLLAKKTLKMAAKLDPDPSKESPLQDYLLDRMTIDELLSAHGQYIKGVAKANPEFEEMSAEQLVALVGKLKKNETPLTDLSFFQCQRLVKFFLDQCD